MGDLLSAASLLLAVIGILYGFWYNELADARSTQIPEHSANCTSPRIRVSRILWSRALPLTASSILLALVFLPDAIRIATDSIRAYGQVGISLESYDAVRTAFCVVVGFECALALHLSWLSMSICRLHWRLRKKECR